MNRCLIYAEDAHNISIEGKGTIDGNAYTEFFNGKTGRPMLMRFLRCNDFHVSNVIIINPASWTTYWGFCDNITVTGVKVVAQIQHNGAALCFDGCINVRVTNCAFVTSVDAPEEMYPMKAMHHFNFNNIIIDNSGSNKESTLFITGMSGHYISDIQLSDIQMILPGGGTIVDASKRHLNEYTQEVLKGWRTEYSLIGTLPASVIYIRHANDISLNNNQIKTIGKDERAPIVFEDVHNYSINEVYADRNELKKIIWIK